MKLSDAIALGIGLYIGKEIGYTIEKALLKLIEKSGSYQKLVKRTQKTTIRSDTVVKGFCAPEIDS